MSNALCYWGNLNILFAWKISGATYKINVGALIQLGQESVDFLSPEGFKTLVNQKQAESLLTVLTLVSKTYPKAPYFKALVTMKLNIELAL